MQSQVVTFWHCQVFESHQNDIIIYIYVWWLHYVTMATCNLGNRPKRSVQYKLKWAHTTKDSQLQDTCNSIKYSTPHEWHNVKEWDTTSLRERAQMYQVKVMQGHYCRQLRRCTGNQRAVLRNKGDREWHVTIVSGNKKHNSNGTHACTTAMSLH